ncbi:ATP-grasp domain-containing protein [Ketobacter sp.]
MSRVLLLDTNLSAYPIHQFLVGQGHDVFVLGGNPDDYLAKISKNYIQYDYSDRIHMPAILNHYKVDYLVPGCNDLSYIVCAELNEVTVFNGIDSVATTHVLNNKKQFRQFAIENKIPVPVLLTESEALDQLPVIVKPVDSYSGRGVTVIRKRDDCALQEAITLSKSQSRSGQYLIEKYVQGQLLSHSAFLKDQKIMLDFFVEEQCIASPFAVDTSRVVTGFSCEMSENIRRVVEQMAANLGLADGLFHSQFIMQDDDCWIIEVTRRCPGDLYSLLIEYSTGIKYADMYTNPFLGNPQVVVGTPSTNLIVRHTITTPEETYFSSIKFIRPVKQVGYFSLARSGDQIGLAPLGRIGIFFTESDSQEEQALIYDELTRRVLYVIE